MSRKAFSLFVFALTVSLISPIPSKAQDDDTAGAVFVMTNAADKNEVISYQRSADGSLRQAAIFATGGRGSGGNTDPLESQGSLTLSRDRSLLFAVNAGSGTVSLFRVHGALLTLIQTVPVSGSEPVAVSQHGHLVYVLNSGGSSEVSGFRLFDDKLVPIRNSVRFLSTNTSGAASLSFSPDGRFLVVSEKLTNNFDVFRVLADGTLSSPLITADVDPGLFSVSFAPNGALIVAETGPAGGSNASTAASYAVQAGGTLSPISTAVPTLGNANCWNAVTPDGRFVYNSNAGSATIAGFAIAQDGTLTALPGTVVGSNPAGATNLDIAVSSDSKFVYTLNTGNGTIGIFAIQPDGTLNSVGSVNGVSAKAGFNGIAAN